MVYPMEQRFIYTLNLARIRQLIRTKIYGSDGLQMLIAMAWTRRKDGDRRLITWPATALLIGCACHHFNYSFIFRDAPICHYALLNSALSPRKS